MVHNGQTSKAQPGHGMPEHGMPSSFKTMDVQGVGILMTSTKRSTE
jgi:hypothetical protein